MFANLPPKLVTIATFLELSEIGNQQHPFNDHLSRTTWVSRDHKGKMNLDFTDAGDSEWQWHQLGNM